MIPGLSLLDYSSEELSKLLDAVAIATVIDKEAIEIYSQWAVKIIEAKSIVIKREMVIQN